MSISTSNRSFFVLGSFIVAFATTGCDAIQDLAQQVYDHDHPNTDTPPVKDPGPGTTPPKETPPVVDPGPKACASSESCGAGQHCSVEDGDCKVPPGCGGDVACPAVCYGVCVASHDPPPPPAECATDVDCETFSKYCGGCLCEAQPTGTTHVAGCPSDKLVQCFADPCLNQKAVCKAGACVIASRDVPPPAPKCEKRTMGGPTSCKDAGTWKTYAADDCKQSGLVLQEIAPRETCGIVAGYTVYVDYVCCGP